MQPTSKAAVDRPGILRGALGIAASRALCDGKSGALGQTSETPEALAELMQPLPLRRYGFGVDALDKPSLCSATSLNTSVPTPMGNAALPCATATGIIPS